MPVKSKGLGKGSRLRFQKIGWSGLSRRKNVPLGSSDAKRARNWKQEQ